MELGELERHSHLWVDSYKPSTFSGVFGSSFFTQPIPFFPKTFAEYIEGTKDGPKGISSALGSNLPYARTKFQSRVHHIRFDMNHWYPVLKDFSFDTRFLEVSPSFAEALLRFYRIRYCGGKKSGNRLSREESNEIHGFFKELEKAIDHCLNELWPDSPGLFIRFSNRSPKDGHKYSRSHPKEYQSELDACFDSMVSLYRSQFVALAKLNSAMKLVNSKDKSKDSESDDESKKDDNVMLKEDVNLRMLVFCHCTADEILIQNSRDAMALILSSERVFTDFIEVLRAHEYPYRYLFTHEVPTDQTQSQTLNTTDAAYISSSVECDTSSSSKLTSSMSEPKKKFDFCQVKLALRKWDPLVSGHFSSLEFRCFVFNHRMTGISQYNHYACFPWLASPMIVNGTRRITDSDLTDYLSQGLLSQKDIDVLNEMTDKNGAFVMMLRRIIYDYWLDHIKEAMKQAKIHNYIVDFGMIDKDLKQQDSSAVKSLSLSEHESRMRIDRWKCIVIEINPYARTTGAGLFRWDTDEHLLRFGPSLSDDASSSSSSSTISEEKSREDESEVSESVMATLPEIRVHHLPVVGEGLVDHAVGSFTEITTEQPWDELLEECTEKTMESSVSHSPTKSSRTGCLIC